jgi:hypothetical protein
MSDLANHLISEMPRRLKGNGQWNSIAENLKAGDGLELALSKEIISDGSDLLREITSLTSEYVAENELRVFRDVIEGGRELRFGKLLPFLSASQSAPLQVITTNYDRLIEFTAELKGWGVDSMFLGQIIGSLDPTGSRLSFVKALINRKPERLVYRKRLCIAKPHGSLDWFKHVSGPVRSQMQIGSPLVITPGTSKYRRGYEIPFDAHRNKANEFIDNASRFLIIGYGFNDDHLEIHLRQQLQAGKPCVIISRELTSAAETLVTTQANILAVTSAESGGFCITTASGKINFPGPDISDISTFVTEVLEP